MLLIPDPRLDAVVYDDALWNLEYAGILHPKHAVIDPVEVLSLSNTSILLSKNFEQPLCTGL